MDIDPRWVSTPVGAAIGVVLAKKLLDKKDQTKLKLAVGGGIGAGAGFLAGQYIKGEPGDISTPDRYQKYVEKQVPVGMPSEQEISALSKFAPIYGDIKAEPGLDVVGNLRRRLAMSQADEIETMQAYRARVIALDRALENPNISARTRNVLETARKHNAKASDLVSGRRWGYTGGAGMVRVPVAGIGAMSDTVHVLKNLILGQRKK